MYKIIRMYYPDKWARDSCGDPLQKKSRTIKTGLTLEQAQKHCNDPKTKKEGVYFDAYEET